MILLFGLTVLLLVILTAIGIRKRIKSAGCKTFRCFKSITENRVNQTKSKSVASPDLTRYKLSHYWWPGQEDWMLTKADIFYYSLGNYVPYRYKPYHYPFLKNHKTEIAHVRKLVYDFKYNLQQPNPVAHAYAVEEAARRISFIVNRSFEGLTSCITFLCLPSSSNLIYNLRFREFAALVCRETGMTDAFDYVYVKGEKTPKHKGGTQIGTFIVDHEWLSGRNVILFDDVVSSGHTIDVYGKAVEAWGVRVLCALTLARTVSPEEMEQGIYRSFSLEKKLKARDQMLHTTENQHLKQI